MEEYTFAHSSAVKYPIHIKMLVSFCIVLDTAIDLNL